MYEVCEPVSFFLINSGSMSAGKSVRTDRLAMLAIPGWLVQSGKGTEQAGTHGGSDKTDGRVMVYDEVPADLGSNGSGRVDYLKQITSAGEVSATKSMQVVNPKTGVKEWRTVLLRTIHRETHVVNANTGQLGLARDEVPDDNRIPIEQRSISNVFLADSGADTLTDVQFSEFFHASENRIWSNQFRIVSGLVAIVLLFTQHCPWMQPNMDIFNAVCSDLDEEMMHKEYGYPKPPPRKINKRAMLARVAAAEAQVVRKFWLKQSAADYEDMRPNEEGYIKAFDILQLTDVICGFATGITPEITIEAWSHTLSNNLPTNEAMFAVKHALAEKHGIMACREIWMQTEKTPANAKIDSFCSQTGPLTTNKQVYDNMSESKPESGVPTGFARFEDVWKTKPNASSAPVDGCVVSHSSSSPEEEMENRLHKYRTLRVLRSPRRPPAHEDASYRQRASIRDGEGGCECLLQGAGREEDHDRRKRVRGVRPGRRGGSVGGRRAKLRVHAGEPASLPRGRTRGVER